MDESGSVTKADFERQKNFVKDLAGNFEFGPNAAQFGVITYSTGAQLDITLSQYKTSALFAQRVNSIKHAGIVFFFSFLFACLKQTKNTILSLVSAFPVLLLRFFGQEVHRPQSKSFQKLTVQ